MSEPIDRPFTKDQRVVIISQTHPHANEQGLITGEVIDTTGQFIVELLNCQHRTSQSAAMPNELKLSSEVTTASAITAPASGGRPTTYSQEIVDRICEGVAVGDSMRTVLRAEGMPAMSTVFLWLREHDEFSEQYTRAKEWAADAMAEDILDIADDGTNDWTERERSDGSTFEVINSEVLQRSRLRVDTRKWLMEKHKPKKYGPKVDVTSGGEKIERGMSIEEINAVLVRAETEKQQAEADAAEASAK